MPTLENPTQSELDEARRRQAEEDENEEEQGERYSAADDDAAEGDAAPDDEPGRIPQEAGREALTDLSGDNAGQQTKVGHPYSSQGGVVRGTERALQSDEDSQHT